MIMSKQTKIVFQALFQAGNKLEDKLAVFRPLENIYSCNGFVEL